MECIFLTYLQIVNVIIYHETKSMSQKPEYAINLFLTL